MLKTMFAVPVDIHKTFRDLLLILLKFVGINHNQVNCHRLHAMISTKKYDLVLLSDERYCIMIVNNSRHHAVLPLIIY